MWPQRYIKHRSNERSSFQKFTLWFPHCRFKIPTTPVRRRGGASSSGPDVPPQPGRRFPAGPGAAHPPSFSPRSTLWQRSFLLFICRCFVTLKGMFSFARTWLWRGEEYGKTRYFITLRCFSIRARKRMQSYRNAFVERVYVSVKPVHKTILQQLNPSGLRL